MLMSGIKGGSRAGTCVKEKIEKRNNIDKVSETESPGERVVGLAGLGGGRMG